MERKIPKQAKSTNNSFATDQRGIFQEVQGSPSSLAGTQKPPSWTSPIIHQAQHSPELDAFGEEAKHDSSTSTQK